MIGALLYKFQRSLEKIRRNPELRLGGKPPTKVYSLEFTLIGRNDEYEPNWSRKMEAVLVYNHRLFDSSGVNFRVAFVEWNPLKGKPLLSPALVEKYPFVRAIVVDPNIHTQLCQAERLSMLLNFPYNAAIRTSSCDFILISGGDIFFGQDVARWFIERGLRKGCLYRAIRVDVRRDLDFLHPRAESLEDRRNAVRVAENNRPPYYNACGDFILMDKTSFQRIRGYDEGMRHVRLHLDSRCCSHAMALGLTSQLIGTIYHIDHGHSHANLDSHHPDDSYAASTNPLYQNPETWGLGDRRWEKRGDRLTYVS